MLEHLILTVDYTKEWEQAMEQLPALLRLLGTKKVTLTYVLQTHKRLHRNDTEGAATERLRTIGETLAGALGVETSTHVASGFVAQEVQALARRLTADGVIACNRSHRVGKELFFGNTALNLARTTRVPLLIIPVQDQPSAAEEEILLATDGSKASFNAQTAFEKLMANQRAGRVVWAHSEQPEQSDEATEQQINELAERLPNVHRNILIGRPVDQILQTINDTRPLLTIMGKRGSTPIQEIMIGSTTEHVAAASPYPVLMMP
ncbi:MAG: universal stress protein family protein [Marinobacter excellens HL-55]|uniref:Universal stress protein family protein n=1 Tax=Marinobacter excellens HL-55 TaxID=1305731 RepID=A0A0P7YJL7_9GAMM|nr:MAG: universal stress protein family protein [Marinobacter excellens HL-55]